MSIKRRINLLMGALPALNSPSDVLYWQTIMRRVCNADQSAGAARGLMIGETEDGIYWTCYWGRGYRGFALEYIPQSPDCASSTRIDIIVHSDGIPGTATVLLNNIPVKQLYSVPQSLVKEINA